MPVALGFKTPEDKLKRILRDLQEHPAIMRKAITFALDDTAEGLKREQIMEMEVVFQSPRKYTLNALYAVKARGQVNGDGVTTAGLAWKEVGGSIPAYKYLYPQVFGGPRRYKRHEKSLQAKGILPAGSMTAQGRSYPKDESGDITGGQYTRMLSELDALQDGSGGKNQYKKKRAAASRFFVFTPKGASYPVGIAEPNGDGIRVMLRFIQPPNYTARYDYYGIANEYTRINFPKQLERQWLKWQPLGGYGKNPFALAA